MTETPIRIGLPLPFDVVASLSYAFDAMYPDSKIKTSAHPGEMVILIDDEHRRPRVGKKKLRDAKVTAEAGIADVQVLGWEDDHLALSTPEELSLMLAAPCAHLIAAFEDAVNYVELEVEHDGNRYTVAACRSRGQTPHALRMKAEQERDEARAEVDRLRAELEAVRGG